ncbi:MAG: NeuD/PglB/VioB family sugar acetyltransferase [Gammaproteobacteria bacterium]|nr:NeuD/PglB/VioB family sugar acetyltransferase [Gammaproteobacteria bacterium]
MKTLAILGGSGHGKVVAEIAELVGWQDIVFFDDAFPAISSVGAWKVRGTTDDLVASADKYPAVIVAIGENAVRLDKSKYLYSKDFKLATLLHPCATISKYANVCSGTVVMAGAVINPFVSIGMASIINTSSSIDHDCMLGEGVHVSPGVHVAGDVSIGDLSWLGIGSVVKQCVEIGSSVIVGAGAVVVNNIAPNLLVKGIPAK